MIKNLRGLDAKLYVFNSIEFDYSIDTSLVSKALPCCFASNFLESPILRNSLSNRISHLILIPPFKFKHVNLQDNLQISVIY